jgi:hypothetical protein
MDRGSTAHLKELSQQYPGVTERNHENFNQDSSNTYEIQI